MTPLSTRIECKELLAELKTLDEVSTNEFVSRKYEIIHDLAEAHCYEAKDYLVAGLDSTDPDYRWSCISALVTHWADADSRIIAKLYEMIWAEPDVSTREIAIDSFGILGINEALSALTKLVVSESESESVKKAAYLAILRILKYPPVTINRLWAQFRLSDIDFNLLDTLIDPD